MSCFSFSFRHLDVQGELHAHEEHRSLHGVPEHVEIARHHDLWVELEEQWGSMHQGGGGDGVVPHGVRHFFESNFGHMAKVWMRHSGRD